jgi:MscS family membrane protein
MSLLGWNPVNFIDGEGPWIIGELGIVCVAIIVSKLLGVFLFRIAQRLPLFAATCLRAAYAPMLFCVWYFVILDGLERVTHHFFSEEYPRMYALFVASGVTGTIGWWLFRSKNRLFTLAMESSQQRAGMSVSAIYVLSKLASVVIVVLICIVLGDIAGKPLTALLAVGGVGGLAVAFASQELIANFFGGLMVYVTRPFVIGDRISLPAHSIEGKVEEIGWYQTMIRESSKACVHVANSMIGKTSLVNKSRMTHRYFNETVFVSFQDHKNSLIFLDAVAAMLRKDPHVDTSQDCLVYIAEVRNSVLQICMIAYTSLKEDKEFFPWRTHVLVEVIRLAKQHAGEMAAPVCSCSSGKDPLLKSTILA